MNRSSLISVSELSVTFGGRRIIENLDFEILSGECVILSGANGAGKTTLLRILAGLLQPDTGYYCLHNDTDSQRWKTVRCWLLKNIVYLHQTPYIFDSDVRENIMYGLRRRGLKKPEARRKADDALNWGGLNHLARRNGLGLSGGEKQRVALLRAWVLNPALLLLDEPIANMDDNGRHSTLFLIRRLIGNGTAVVITAHEPRLFLPMVNRHLHMENGTLHKVTPPSFHTPPPFSPVKYPQRWTEQHDWQH